MSSSEQTHHLACWLQQNLALRPRAILALVSASFGLGHTPVAAHNATVHRSEVSAAVLFALVAQTAGRVIINEANWANTMGLRDEDGDPKDWVELYNPTAQAVDLSGAGISNKSATPFKWVFPAGAS
jgi:hypothetical protein